MVESLEQVGEPVTYPGAEMGNVRPGRQLAEAREAKGYTQDYIASRLHLRIQLIALIEADAYDALPQPVFVQGYLRAYAKLLGLLPEPLVAQYEACRAPVAKQQERILRQRAREPLYREVVSRLFFLMGGFLVVMGGYYWWHHHDKAAASRLSTTTVEARKDTLSKVIDLSAMESPPVTQVPALSTMEPS